MIYFDHAASMALFEDVQNELARSFKTDFANSSAGHRFGSGINSQIETIRKDFLEWGPVPKGFKFIFTSSATESNNLIIRGLKKTKSTAFVSFADHPSAVGPTKSDWNAESIPLNSNGTINKELFLAKINESVGLIVFNFVNNQTGVYDDIDSLVKEVRNLGCSAHIHVDAAQGYAKVPMNCSRADSLSVCGHKMGGPKGIAGLYIREGVEISPLMIGGGHEYSLRPSTLPFPLISAWNKAMQFYKSHGGESYKKVYELKSILVSEIKKIRPNCTFPFAINAENSSPYILCFSLSGLPSDMLLRLLEQKGIITSSSSACSSKVKANPALDALGLSKEHVGSLLRVSLWPLTAEEEVLLFLKGFKESLDQLESMGIR